MDQVTARSSIKNRFNDLPKIARLKVTGAREWVYFLQAEVAPPLIKIGHATNLKWRLCGLQTQCPVQLKLVGAILGPAGTEFVFHEAFKAERAHGEWFELSGRLNALIKELPKGKPVSADAVRALAGTLGVARDKVDAILYDAMRYVRSLDKKGLQQYDADVLDGMSSKKAREFAADGRFMDKYIQVAT